MASNPSPVAREPRAARDPALWARLAHRALGAIASESVKPFTEDQVNPTPVCRSFSPRHENESASSMLRTGAGFYSTFFLPTLAPPVLSLSALGAADADGGTRARSPTGRAGVSARAWRDGSDTASLRRRRRRRRRRGGGLGGGGGTAVTPVGVGGGGRGPTRRPPCSGGGVDSVDSCAAPRRASRRRGRGGPPPVRTRVLGVRSGVFPTTWRWGPSGKVGEGAGGGPHPRAGGTPPTRRRVRSRCSRRQSVQWRRTAGRAAAPPKEAHRDHANARLAACEC